MKTIEIKDVLFFDVETTGLPPKGAKYETDYKEFPYIVEIAWIIGDKARRWVVQPKDWVIPQEATNIHGISHEIAITEGIPYADIMEEFIKDANDAKLVCAHNIYFDTSNIKAHALRTPGVDTEALDSGLWKGKRIDTMMKSIRFVGAKFANGRPGKFPTLEELYAKLFNGETFPAHQALEDVKALKRCLPELVENGVIELKVKEYPKDEAKEQSTTQAGVFESITFEDAPVKCATFCPETIPADVRKRMDEDREEAERCQKMKALLAEENF